MVGSLAFLLALTAAHADTTLVLGIANRDLTGDGRPETLSFVASGRTIDSLDLTFTIESDGAVIYEMKLRPVTRTIGFGSARRRRSSAEHRRHLAELGPFFLDDRKFMSPPQFLEELRNTIARGIREIPSVIARDGGFPEDTARAAAIWREMQDTGITIFQFSPGGDRVVVIGWSQRDRRFYDLLECC